MTEPGRREDPRDWDSGAYGDQARAEDTKEGQLERQAEDVPRDSSQPRGSLGVVVMQPLRLL